MFSQLALQPKDADEAVLTSIRVLSAFFISRGYSRTSNEGPTHDDHTVWEAFSDLKNRRYLYQTYDNPSLRVIELKQADFQPGPMKVIPDRSFVPTDVTAKAQATVPSS
jgi:penicillin V acylase-like amidase (Ntn superfamily)